MSFLVKKLLGNNVVHPSVQERNDSPVSKKTDEKRVSTRTLILRVQSCTVPQDRRDALRELQTCPDLPYVMTAKEALYFCDTLRNFADDDAVVDSSLALLSSITDLSCYPICSLSQTYTLTDKDKRQIRDSFLHELVCEVPLILGYVNAGSFWSRFNAVQLLQRLQEHDSLAVHKLLLSSHGIGVLVDILNDNSHGGALRNEGLVLITSITAMDTELQTLLAFDNAFDTLFAVVKEEGGIDGGVIVSDCLTIAQNMLRDNKATQNFFCDMGCARLVCKLLETVPERIQLAISHNVNGKKQTDGVVDDANASLAQLSSLQNDALFMAVSILSCVLRGTEANKESIRSKDALLHSGVLYPLASVAFAGAAIDDRVRVEALRTLAVLLFEQRVGIENFLQLQVLTLLLDGDRMRVKKWSAPRAVLNVLLDVEDRVVQSAAAQVFNALLSVPACEVRVSSAFVRGFSLSPSLTTQGVGVDVGERNSFATDCGVAIANALFGDTFFSKNSRKYYVALLLDRILSVPNTAELLLSPSKFEEETATSCLARETTTSARDSVFLAYVHYITKCFGGHGEMDLNTLSACFRLLLRWTLFSKKACKLFLSDTVSYMVLLQRAKQDNGGPVHVRFWSAILCATLCIAAFKDESTSVFKTENNCGDKERIENNGCNMETSSKPLLREGQRLLDLFYNHLGGPFIFEGLLFDVKASSPTWSDPPQSALLRPTPVLYDVAMKCDLIDIIKKFNDICFLRSKTFEEQGAGMELKDVASQAASTSVPAVAIDVDLVGSEQFLRSTSWHVTAQTEGPPAAAAPVVSDVADSQLRDVYEAKVRELTERNAALEQQFQLFRERAAADAEERERLHTTEVNYLNENIKLLDEALSNREEEHHVLVQSLKTLEEQLRVALANHVDTSEVLALRQELCSVKKERDQLLILAAELDESLTPSKVTGEQTLSLALCASNEKALL